MVARTPPRPTLSVITAVHERGASTAAGLKLVRSIADEIVVAFDSRISRDELGPLEEVCDALVGFEWGGSNRFRPWLREQAKGEWLLILDGDELVSCELLKQLPELISRKDVSGYVLPCWWVFPDARTRLIAPPWGPDKHVRLARMTGSSSRRARHSTPAMAPPAWRVPSAP